MTARTGDRYVEVPGGRLRRAVVWEDVAHMIGMEQPGRLMAEIVAFAGSLPRW